MKAQTGCDGIMVGRAARGNPWIFREIQAALSREPAPEPPGWEELRQTILEHGRMICEEKGEYTGMREMRAHMGFYIRGFRGSSRLRGAMQHLSSYQEMVELMKAFPSDGRIKD